MTKEAETTRVTQQYRDRDRRMVYEMRCGDASVVLLASQKSDAAENGEWRFEAHPRESPQVLVAGEWKPTRTEAFRTMRELWVERGPSLGLPSVEWEKVATALTAVRAI